MTALNNAQRFNAVIENLTALREKASDEAERAVWDATIASAHAARKVGEAAFARKIPAPAVNPAPTPAAPTITFGDMGRMVRDRVHGRTRSR